MKSTFLASTLLGAALTCAAAPDVTATRDFAIGTTMHYTHDAGILDESLSVMKQGGHNSWRGDALTGGALTADGQWRGINFRTMNAAKAGKAAGVVALPIYNCTCKAMNFDFAVGPNLPPFVKFSLKAADSFQGLTPYCQIWNEWDGGCGMEHSYGLKMKHNTAENYVILMKELYPKLKKAHPDLIVMANSVCTGEKFLYRTFELGILDYCDAYTIHTYNLNATPEQVYERVLKMAATSAKHHHGVSKPFYITEMSWYTCAKTVSEATQGDYCARLYLLMKSIPSCRGLWWYNFNDRGDNAEDGQLFWGMVMRDMTPKDAYYALSSVSETVKKGTFVKRLPSRDPNVWLMLYKMPNNTYTLAAWTLKDDVRIRIILKKGKTAPGPLVLERAGAKPVKRRWGYRDQTLRPYNHQRYHAPEKPELFCFHTTTRPMLLAGLPADFTVDSVTEIAMPQRKATAMMVPSDFMYVRRKPVSTLIDSDEFYRILPGKPQRAGAKDLSCRFSASYTNTALCLTFDVTDNVHHAHFDDLKLWNGDSIQLGLYPVTTGFPFTKAKPLLVNVAADEKRTCVSTPGADGSWVTNNEIKVQFKKLAPGRVRYTVTIPFTKCGATLKELLSGRKFLGFTALINDNDGTGRKGYLRWGDGMGTGIIDPLLFGALLFR